MNGALRGQALLDWSQAVAAELSILLDQPCTAERDRYDGGEYSERTRIFIGEGQVKGLNREVTVGTNGYGTAANRVTFWGAYPDSWREALGYGWHHGWSSPTITVADDREPKAVAKDILRRLIPLFEEALASAHSTFLVTMAQRRGNAAVVARIEEAVGSGGYQEWGNRKENDGCVSQMSWHKRDHLRFHSDPHVQFTIEHLLTATPESRIDLKIQAIPVEWAITVMNQLIAVEAADEEQAKETN